VQLSLGINVIQVAVEIKATLTLCAGKARSHHMNWLGVVEARPSKFISICNHV
jgi:hypothetical protein